MTSRICNTLARLTDKTQAPGAGAGKTIGSEHNLVGSTTDVDCPGGPGLTLQYDDVHRLKKVIDDDVPGEPVAEYMYNKAGEVLRLELRNGTFAEHAYNEVGQLEALENVDALGWVISSNEYVRNKVVCPTKIAYHDGRYRFYDYDDLYRLTREEHWTPQQANLLWHGYDYDPAGNRTSKQHDSASGPELGYTYNEMNQLTDQVGETGNRADVAGTVTDENLASVTVWNTAPDPDEDFNAQLRQRLFIARAVELEEDDNDLYALALDKAGNESRYPENVNEYHTVTLDSSVDRDYVYDDNGCLIEIVESSTVLKEYTYDYENRLVKVVEDPGGTPVTLAEYVYDGLGRRVWSNVGGVETRFIYDGESVIEEYEYDSGWLLAAVYVHGAGTDNVLGVTRDGQTFYYHYDGLGSVTELTDADGLLAQAYEYDAWGIPTIYDPEHASGNPYLFTGRRWDVALALYYYRARHYAPDLGRFLQPDPIGYEQTTNLYAYVGGMPTVFIDPSGMQGSTEDEFWDKHGERFIEELYRWDYVPADIDFGDFGDQMAAVSSLPEDYLDEEHLFSFFDSLEGGTEMALSWFDLPDEGQMHVRNMVADRVTANVMRKLSKTPTADMPTDLKVLQIALECTPLDDWSVLIEGEHMTGNEAGLTDYLFAAAGPLSGPLSKFGKVFGKGGRFLKVLGKHGDELADFGKHIDEVKQGARALDDPARRVVGALEETQGLGKSKRLIGFKPRIPPGDDKAKYGMSHIIKRHAYSTTEEGTSRFAKNMGRQEIKQAIEEAAQKATKWDVEGGSRVLDMDLGRVIGVDKGGADATWLRVVTDADGNVITSYPIRGK